MGIRNKIRFGAIAFAAVLAPALFAQTTSTQATLSPEIKAEVLGRVSTIMRDRAFVPGLDLKQWDSMIANEKESIDKATNAQEFAEAIRSALAKFGISHVALMTPAQTLARTERKAVGIGINIQPQEDGILVTNVFEGSPAFEAKIEPGDVIVEADGKKLTASSSIIGDEGTQVEIKIRKPDGKERTLKLTRRKFNNTRADTLTWPNAETAVIKINTFDLAYDRKKIDEFMAEARKAKNLVLDLRSNGGGAVINMLHLLGYLTPETDRFGVFVNRTMVNRFVEETGGSPTELRKIAMTTDAGWLKSTKQAGGIFKGNVAVLINGGSGSASEITAQALRELRDAPVLGSKSAGAVLVSTMLPVSNGFTLQFPISDYMSAQGVRLEGNGIVPDLEVPMPRFGEKDEAIDKAIMLLRRIELRNQRSGGG